LTTPNITRIRENIKSNFLKMTASNVQIFYETIQENYKAVISHRGGDFSIRIHGVKNTVLYFNVEK